MPEAVTMENVWKMFQETNRQFREMSAETDRRMEEAALRMKETDR